MSEDTDELIREAKEMNACSERIKICFDTKSGEIGFDIDFRKRASLMSYLEEISYDTYPVFDEEGEYRGYMEKGIFIERNL